MITILIFLLLLSILVFAHELGHFWVAKKAGMKVEEFGFGFPPRLFGIRRGETTYSFNAIPLGGFVRILGENGESRDDPNSFSAKSRTKRFFVLVAGVVMNVLLAWFLLSAGFMFGLPSVLDEPMPSGAKVRDERIEVLFVLPGSPADTVGMKSGDKILSVNGEPAEVSDAARANIGKARVGDIVRLEIERDDESMTLEAVAAQITNDIVGVGVQIADVGVVRFSPPLAIIHGARMTANMIVQTAEGFWSLVLRLISGDGEQIEVSGPIGIAVMTGEMAKDGLGRLIFFAALLSVNLAILNILPIPALDGGRILFVLIEAITRRAVTHKIERTIHAFGFMALMFLVILVTYKDIAGIFAK